MTIDFISTENTRNNISKDNIQYAERYFRFIHDFYNFYIILHLIFLNICFCTLVSPQQMGSRVEFR